MPSQLRFHARLGVSTRVLAVTVATLCSVAFGACAISGGLYASAPAIDRAFLEEVGPALYVPGCPPHPLTFVHAILDLLGVR